MSRATRLGRREERCSDEMWGASFCALHLKRFDCSYGECPRPPTTMFVAMFAHHQCAPELIGLCNTREEAEALVCGYLVRSGALFDSAWEDMQNVTDASTIVVDLSEETVFLNTNIDDYFGCGSACLTSGGFYLWLARMVEQFPENGISLLTLLPFIDKRPDAPRYHIAESPPPPPPPSLDLVKT
jgi:hypothetical protein